jgi:hypothetical protein
MNTFDESAPSTCFDTPNWKDRSGDGCDWYEAFDEPGCPQKGNLYDGNMGVAKDNCCYCGGGSHTLPPSTSPKPSSSPTKSATPTEICFDTPNWKDSWGTGCDWYEKYDKPGCFKHGSLYEGSMGVAKDNCCYCGGGSHTLPPTTSPKPSSSPTKSATPSSFPSSAPSMCTDKPGWNDYRGYDCSWYEVVDDPGCPKHGNMLAGDFSTAQGSAKDHCCYCQNAVDSNFVSES